MPLGRSRRQYEQLSQFERGRIICMMEAGWSAMRVVRQLGRSDCVMRRCWDQSIREMSFTQRPGSGHPRQTSRREDPHIVVFSDESRFNFRSDDNRVRVWKPRGERPNPAFALQRYTAPTSGVTVWGAIACNTRSPLVLNHGTMTAQRYVYDILQSHVLPVIQRLPEAIFQQDKGHKTVSALLLPFLGLPDPQNCLQSSISGFIWDGGLSLPQV
ncbi:transposable element Tcb2 transposase [Trichonephila clavipes]|nr:transposable element Tcb2 transposase [Trichonephila clavipes]